MVYINRQRVFDQIAAQAIEHAVAHPDLFGIQGPIRRLNGEINLSPEQAIAILNANQEGAEASEINVNDFLARVTPHNRCPNPTEAFLRDDHFIHLARELGQNFQALMQTQQVRISSALWTRPLLYNVCANTGFLRSDDHAIPLPPRSEPPTPGQILRGIRQVRFPAPPSILPPSVHSISSASSEPLPTPAQVIEGLRQLQFPRR